MNTPESVGSDATSGDAINVEHRHRILYVIDTLEPGGTEESLLAVCEKMDRSRFEPVVCHVYRGDALRRRFEASGIRVVSLDVCRKYGFAQAAARLRSVIRETSSALVHTMLFRASQVGRVVGRWSGLPVVSTFSGVPYAPERLENEPQLRPLKMWLLRRTDALTAGLVTAFHSVSTTVGALNCRHLAISPERVRVIPRGRDPGSFESGPQAGKHVREALAVSGRKPVLIHVGRFDPSKSHATLIDAMPRIRELLTDAVLLLAGDGSLRPEMEARVRELNLTSSIRFLGHRSDVPALLAASDVFVFPSRHEGMPGSVIEAMLAGVPVVASNVPMLAEMIEHEQTGFLTPPGDVTALADSVIRLCRDEDLRTVIAERARRAACDDYDIRHIARKMEKFYTDVLSRSPRTESS